MAAGIACDFRREGGYEDRISALPDDMLLQILARLGCARAAAETGVLARRWRGLWTRLPVLTFRRVAPDSLDAALALLPRPAPSLALLDVDDLDRVIEPTRLSSLLGAAAALAPAELVVHVNGGILRGPVELPCFDGTASIKLDMYAVGFTLPPAGGFPALESLHLENCHVDLSDLLPRCPRLRKLRIPFWNSGSVTVSSPSLEEFSVYANLQIEHLEIVAPVLKKLYLNARRGIHENCIVSFSAPEVEDLTWKCESQALSDRFGVMWRLWSLTFSTSLQPLGHSQLPNSSESEYLQSKHRRVGVLSLNLETNVWAGEVVRTFEQEIYRVQVTNFSILELDLKQRGHAYGAMVLHLLGLCTSIQGLKVTLDDYLMGNACCADCRCGQPNNLRSQSISLTDLKEVEIRRFRGKDHELDLLKLLLRCAAVLERVTLRFSRKFPPSDHVCKEIDGILKSYPSVKSNIYH